MASIRLTMHVDPIQYYEDASDAPFTLVPFYIPYGDDTAVNGIVPTITMLGLPPLGSHQVSHSFANVSILNSRELGFVNLTVDPNGELHFPFTLPSYALGMTVHVQAVVFSSPNYSGTEGVTFTVLP